ncbi:MAG: RpiB/LacA/LacB family sugar-phosphate isomerase [Anaerovoracaceae bacterium]
MRIAVINEVSASQRNADIITALEGSSHTVYNAGMQNPEQKPELTYIHTGLMAAVLLNANAVDLVVGGCGTGQGFLNSAMQYPGVFCGLIVDSLDAWLFTQINGGNCISLPLNKGYGWAGDVNLGFVFEKLFACKAGAGYPEHRKESQKISRETLGEISVNAHRSMDEILKTMNEEILTPISQWDEFGRLLRESGDCGRNYSKYFE